MFVPLREIVKVKNSKIHISYSNDGKTTIGITSLSRVFHLHESSTTSTYSIRVHPSNEVDEQEESGSSKLRDIVETLSKYKRRKSHDRSARSPRASISGSLVGSRASSPKPGSRRRKRSSVMSKTARGDAEFKLDGIVVCVSGSGVWVVMWTPGRDIIFLRARGASIPQDLEIPKFRLREMVLFSNLFA